jgi:hypothetical protein
MRHRTPSRFDPNVTYDAQRAAQNVATPELHLTGYDLIARRLLSVD